HIRIAVIDDGPGMDAALLQEVRSRLESEEEVYRHIGLVNTDKRIKLTYQSAEGLTIRSKRRWGTVITMAVPLQRPDGGGEAE
ncbi:two-component sensor histidine kinase, partial [Paenibacillus sepulcri]|nr:two-component sensor histidine kinase [Paenibacillus sepulcri]